MENGDKAVQDCGCNCEMCAKGDHEHCETGRCLRRKVGTDNDAGDGM